MERRVRSAIWRPQKTPGAQIGKYQSKEQVCTKEAADLFSDAAPAPVHQRQPIASQPVRSWSSIGRYTSSQQRVVVRPRYDSGPEAPHPRRMARTVSRIRATIARASGSATTKSNLAEQLTNMVVPAPLIPQC